MMECLTICWQLPLAICYPVITDSIVVRKLCIQNIVPNILIEKQNKYRIINLQVILL